MYYKVITKFYYSEGFNEKLVINKIMIQSENSSVAVNEAQDYMQKILPDHVVDGSHCIEVSEEEFDSWDGLALVCWGEDPLPLCDCN